MVYYRQNALSYALEIIFHCISNKLFLRAVNLGRDLKDPLLSIHISRVRMKTKWDLFNSSPDGILSFQNLKY